jgi:hypothetical protein
MTLAHALILCRCCAIRHKRGDDQRSIADAFRWHSVQKSGDPFRKLKLRSTILEGEVVASLSLRKESHNYYETFFTNVIL